MKILQGLKVALSAKSEVAVNGRPTRSTSLVSYAEADDDAGADEFADEEDYVPGGDDGQEDEVDAFCCSCFNSVAH